VRSLRNAITHLGFDLIDIQRPDDILAAERLLFPGVGAFGAAMERLHRLGYVEPLREYLAAGRPYLGICIGLQTLFEGSEESPGVVGLGVIPGQVERFPRVRYRCRIWAGTACDRCATMRCSKGCKRTNSISCTPIAPGTVPTTPSGSWPRPTMASPSSARCSAAWSRRCSFIPRRAARVG
jgi:hypothetical protein